MSEENPNPEFSPDQNSSAKTSDRKAVDPKPEIEELTRTVSRLVRASIVTSTDLVSRLVQIHGNMLSDVAATVARPLQSATEKKKKSDELPINVGRASEGFIDMTESADRSIKDVADLLDRSAKRFWDEYNRR